MRFRIAALRTGTSSQGYYKIETSNGGGWVAVQEFVENFGMWNLYLNKYSKALRIATEWKEDVSKYHDFVIAQEQAAKRHEDKVNERQKELYPVDVLEV